MSRPERRRWWRVTLLGLLATCCGTIPGQDPPARPGPRWVAPTSLSDPRLGPLRWVSVSWEMRAGPGREVVDLVCLVPDLPTFFEAVSCWDRGHYFPILIEDVETTSRFIRAFRPARIVRFPRAPSPIAEDRVWERAVAAVGASWTDEADRASSRLAGDSVPKGLGPTPPGVVLSSPSAPMLAGAVALAAGRFQ